MIHMFVGLTFWILAWYTGLKFHAINKLLEEPYKHIYRQFESDDFGNFLQQQFRITSFNNSLCGDLKNDRDRREFIQITKHVHLETTLLTKDINDIYGGLMLVQFGMDFIQFTGFSYALYGIWLWPQVEFKWIRFSIASFWMSAFLLKIFLVNGICASVSKEAKRTGNRIHHFIYSEEDSELFDEMKQFSFQVYNVPVEFSPLGFFKLGDQFVKGFFGTVLTYLIILIQVDEDSSFL
ncbi:gustatory receptor 68a-like [Venturia canescens]|uniref:gustatory receptor 68a-like n=1 Tax=Venturia canescens TaxID=32260 RepID=UPI001C9C1A78|nr:gustatory receptor 68a-like [Venturia canescens]